MKESAPNSGALFYVEVVGLRPQNNLDKLAQMLKDRENANKVGVTIGRVISDAPLRISVGSNIILERGRHLIVSLSAYPLETGDEVILIPDNNLKNWYVIDRAVRT